MSKVFIVIVSGALSLVISGTALAAPPAWCKDASVEPPDLRRLSSKDADEVVKTFVSAACAPSAEADAHRGEIEEARAAWSKRLGMIDADWADAAAWASGGRRDYHDDEKLSTENLAAATPLDQYKLILNAQPPGIDAIYATDMFDGNLSELGRLAFLTTMCFDKGRSVARDPAGLIGTEALWAICQPDFERFDAAKLASELRADPTPDPVLKMRVRFAMYELPPRLKAHTAEVQDMLKRDEGNQKLFKLAVDARAEWSSGVGKNTKLLELVLAMESGQRAKSRKLLADCGTKTTAALAEATATLPKQAFTGMHDDRENPFTGFGSSAGLVLVETPAVNLAAIAYTLCTPKSGISELLSASLHAGPGLRGPRNAALSKIKVAKIEYDKVNAQLSYPATSPYGEDYPPRVALKVTSGGGAVKSVKRNGDVIVVELEKWLVKQEECLVRHKTGRVVRIHESGYVEYEQICDKSGTVVRDHTGQPFELSAKYEAWLKPGVVFSAVGSDVIAIWPGKTAKVPSMVLGGQVK